MNDHGLKQSQEYTKAVQALSEAKEWAGVVSRNPEYYSEKQKQDAKDRLTAAQAARDVAYRAYTNPFNVKKTFN